MNTKPEKPEVEESANSIEVFIMEDGKIDLVVTLDSEEFISENLEENDELQAQYDDYCEVLELEDYYQSALEFAESLEGKGIYGEGEPIVLNTYNEESLLSDAIQLVYWEDDDGDAHVILERHLGGGPRGNYGPQRAFDVLGGRELSIFSHARGNIACDDCNKSWFTEDGCDWINDEDRQNLRDCKGSEEPQQFSPKNDPRQRSLLDAPLSKPKLDNVIFVDEDEKPHCPACGGVLRVYGY